MKMNKNEWFSILLGCISSVFNGASLPVYGIVFGGLVGVSLTHFQDIHNYYEQVFSKVLALPNNDEMRTESNVFCLYFLILGVVSGITMFLQVNHILIYCNPASIIKFTF